MTKPSKNQSYKQLSEQLELAMAWFESDELNIDDAAQKYQEVLMLIERMEEYLKTAKNQIKKAGG